MSSRPETVDETAELINHAGGTAIAVRVDHTVESEVENLMARIDRERARLRAARAARPRAGEKQRDDDTL